MSRVSLENSHANETLDQFQQSQCC